MPSPGHQEPPFDPAWLELIASALEKIRGARPRPLELYLERRLELEVRSTHHAPVVSECRTEGAAIRWALPGRIELYARSGVSRLALDGLLEPHSDLIHLPSTRPAPAAEIDAPRGWIDWARSLTERMGAGSSAAFISRRAAVVSPGAWSVITAPALLRAHHAGETPVALLAVWPHPSLASWLREMAEPRPSRCWRPASGLRTPVLLTNGSAGVLMHELIGHLVEADIATSGGSPLAALNGATITATSLCINDDPTRHELPGAFTCDDEGVEAEPLPLVDKGRLTGWICDRAGAEQLGAPPGRGRRHSWTEPPMPRLSNIIVEPGSTDAASLERDMSRGLLITRLGAATVDPISARALIRVESGWEMKNGRRRRPLAGCELTGPALGILSSIDPALGDDPKPDWRLGWCMKGSSPIPTGSSAPTVLVKSMEVL